MRTLEMQSKFYCFLYFLLFKVEMADTICQMEPFYRHICSCNSTLFNFLLRPLKCLIPVPQLFDEIYKAILRNLPFINIFYYLIILFNEIVGEFKHAFTSYLRELKLRYTIFQFINQTVLETSQVKSLRQFLIINTGLGGKFLLFIESKCTLLC